MMQQKQVENAVVHHTNSSLEQETVGDSNPLHSTTTQAPDFTMSSGFLSRIPKILGHFVSCSYALLSF